ncbi:hypothetical protein EGR_10159 [Echinococcus granulosus]|uniref:Uncharacterized protein n=1 Tax=Echinococcus granulosus TaxID=6210 RepID=W6U1L3_ECHGR|nr:hypothetical protein EGR_10159 [Echinococcus granulosus]EUB54975.1 hypothetical protein EGR_10159 [Echinococcus granulosus]
MAVLNATLCQQIIQFNIQNIQFRPLDFSRASASIQKDHYFELLANVAVFMHARCLLFGILFEFVSTKFVFNGENSMKSQLKHVQRSGFEVLRCIQPF